MESPRIQDSEIDLSSLFKSIGDWFRHAFQNVLFGIARLRQVFVNNLLLFLIFNAVAVTIVISLKLTDNSNEYSSSMILRCDYLNMRILQSSIDKLNLLCKEKERQGLTQVLGISENTAKNIIQFKATPYVSEADRLETELLKEQLTSLVSEKKSIVEKVTKKLELGNLQTFQIQITVKDPSVVSTLDSVLVRFFKSSEFISKRINAHKELIKAKREKLVKESKKLDSLKYVLYDNFRNMAKQSREGSNNVILSDKYLTDPLSVFKEDLTLNNEIQAIDQELKLNPDFEIIDGLTAYRTPSNFRLSIRLLIAIGIATAAGYLLLGLWNFNKYLASLTDKTQA